MLKDGPKLDEKLIYRIGIGLIKGIGPVLTRYLIAYLGDESAIFKESAASLAKVPGIGSVRASALVNSHVLTRAEEELNFIDKHKIDVLYFTDKRYPVRLQVCEDAPLIIYSKGNVDYNGLHTLSVVGTRRPSESGKEICEKLLHELAVLFPELVVVSGMAYGIDICAHKQSLKSGLSTIGVLAHGLDMLYPSVHRDVAVQMLEKGALVTEFLSQTQPDRQNFVRRNRIIAGLGDATMVVESGIKGGALITADIASSYNRDVLAIPGFPGVMTSAGCNFLIKKNVAALVESADDIVTALGWEGATVGDVAVQRILFPNFDTPEEQMLFDLLMREHELTSNELSVKSGVPISKVNAIMLKLEFGGWVKTLPGSSFKIIK